MTAHGVNAVFRATDRLSGALSDLCDTLHAWACVAAWAREPVHPGLKYDRSTGVYQ